MSIAISSTGPSPDATIDPRLGRAAHFLIVTDDGRIRAIDNPHRDASGGAGIQTAQLLIREGVRQVLTGQCGPKALTTLSAASVAVFTGCSGSATQALERLRAGRLQPATAATVAGHHGMA